MRGASRQKILREKFSLWGLDELGEKGSRFRRDWLIRHQKLKAVQGIHRSGFYSGHMSVGEKLNNSHKRKKKKENKKLGSKNEQK